ncbi:MAG: class I SAM-dependent methyltransferase [Bacilli bacterium]|nr:class I SAM-dependent methyltransferase [Bacilli bacterium]
MKNFEGVSNTAFVPLVARIAISKKYPEYFYDKKALELEPYLPKGAKKGSFTYTNLSSVARYYNFDKIVLDFTKEHEKCNVVYLGAGLESAYFRLREKVGNQVHFYEVDLPDVIKTRREVYGGDNENEILISGNLFDLKWADKLIDLSLPSIFLVSGVFQYFHEEEVLRFVKELRKRFPGQRFAFDATTTKGLKFTNWFIKRTGNKTSLMYFGIDDVEDFAKKCEITLKSNLVFFTDARKILKGKTDLISKYGMWNCDKEKKAFILVLDLM